MRMCVCVQERKRTRDASNYSWNKYFCPEHDVPPISIDMMIAALYSKALTLIYFETIPTRWENWEFLDRFSRKQMSVEKYEQL